MPKIDRRDHYQHKCRGQPCQLVCRRSARGGLRALLGRCRRPLAEPYQLGEQRPQRVDASLAVKCGSKTRGARGVGFDREDLGDREVVDVRLAAVSDLPRQTERDAPTVGLQANQNRAAGRKRATR
jgi:hypothetical protein